MSGQVLFKYRHFEDEHHLRLLTEQEIYFAAPSEFEDPNDLAIPPRVDSASDEEIVELYTQVILRLSPHLGQGQASNRAEEHFESFDLRSPDQLESLKKITRDVNSETFGVCSFAVTPNSSHMWRHYADKHRGFCVGLNFEEVVDWAEKIRGEKDIQLFGRPVDYVENIPELDVFKSGAAAVTEQALTTKLEKWSDEEEYRIIGKDIPNTPLVLPKEAFHSVAIGAATPLEKERCLLEIINREFDGVMVVREQKHYGVGGSLNIRYKRIR